jgi:hypothetical protein
MMFLDFLSIVFMLLFAIGCAKVTGPMVTNLVLRVWGE